jgi:hypothetical protein
MFKKIALLAFLAGSFAACDKDEHNHNESELITTITYSLNSSGGLPVELVFKDLDGDGGNAPTITTGRLRANTTYTGTMTFSNESTNPVQDITTEIQSEKSAHQLFYQLGTLNATVAYVDRDENGKPLGLTTTFTTGTISNGTLKITLRHQPNKSAANVATGDITNAGGETDVEVSFPIMIE